MKTKKLILALEGSEVAAEELASAEEADFGSIKWSHFDDGEKQILIEDPEAIRKKEVTLVGSLERSDHFLEMMSLIYAMRHQFRASSVDLHIPEISYEPIKSFEGNNEQEVNQAPAFFQALKLMGTRNFDYDGSNFLPLRKLFGKTSDLVSDTRSKLVYSLDHCADLANEFAEISDQHEVGELSFDAIGRMFVDDPKKLENRDVVLMASLEKDDHFMKAMALTESFRNQFGASSVELIVPYLGYSTMERMSKVPGEVARGIPHVQGLYGMGPKRINFLDLHVENYLNCGGPEGIGEHMLSEKLVVDMIKEIEAEKGEVVLISPDLGRAPWVRSIARLAGGLPHDSLSKIRSKTEKDKTEVGGGDAELVRGKTCIIFDDMVRTGGSAIQAAERLIELGAKEVIMITTHLVLPKSDKVDAEKRMHDSPISTLYGTNSHSRSQLLNSDKIKVRSVANLILQHVKRD